VCRPIARGGARIAPRARGVVARLRRHVGGAAGVNWSTNSSSSGSNT